MQFITCRGCKLPFERKVRTCPNCGETLPGLSRLKHEAVSVAFYLVWGLSFGAGCFVGAEVITRPPGLPESLQWATFLGVPPFIFALSQLLASSIGHRDEAERKANWRLFSFEGAAIGLLLDILLVPGAIGSRDLVIVCWGVLAAIAAGIPATCWWLRLKREAQTCWWATHQLASKGYAEMGNKLRAIEVTRQQAVSELPPQLLAERLAILNRGFMNTHALRARYRACEWQTDLLRWHAQLKVYLEGPAPATMESCQATIAALDKHGARGLEHLKEWRGTEEATYPEPKDCIARIEQLLELCARLRQNVLDHQIMLVTQDPRAGAPEETTFQQLRADLRTLESSIIRGEFQDPWNTAARIESETAQLAAQTEIERELAPTKSEEEAETRLSTRVGGG